MLPKTEDIPIIIERAHQVIKKHLNYRATAITFKILFTGTGPIFT